MTDVILAIDQGTTGSTIALMDTAGHLVASVNHEFPQIFPEPGWVEHNTESIWQSILKGIAAIFADGAYKPGNVVAIGITNQRETAVLWDAQTGEALHNAIVWQCRRTTGVCEDLKAAGHEALIRERSGLVLDPYFSATKFKWLLDNAPGAQQLLAQGRLRAGTIDAYLMWRLSNGKVHKTDVSNASRTSLMALNTLDWDDELLSLFGVPREILPEICPSSGRLAVTEAVPGLPDGLPVSGVAGDQQSALFGQACFEPGDAKCTFGTGSFILMNAGDSPVRSGSGLLSTLAWQLEGQSPVYALEGGAFVCGAAVQWLRDQLGIIEHAADIEALAASVEDAGGVEFVPALTGLGAPYWAPEARGTLTGLTRGSGRGEIARATLDAMAMQNVDILVAMEADIGRAMTSLRVDGGAAINNLLMQLQADYLDRPIMRPEVIETTVAGACFLAGLGEGVWASLSDVSQVWRSDREFSVTLPDEARQHRRALWQTAVAKTLHQ
ncbi:glycerol kinase GlpK [Luminiphilus sp.]|nr:glycerol kinase GlpK [Luminiphilus sp.]MDA9836261.1 glycerol kinase GlpK [Luminiphilus sp.]MDB2659473.1 glycerol kinase GlpK [Luminiphilus sp.]MDB2667660.1 glycerol kinase GlpK [Luminiphilus sp.]MDC0508190.1 glycerol kinase GlpK [Luminiphilus sp.]